MFFQSAFSVTNDQT